MFRRREPRHSAAVEGTPQFNDLYRWVLSLPWVVERPRDAAWPDVRLFAIECEPLQRRRIWLITGLAEQSPLGETDGADVAAVMPDHPSRAQVSAEPGAQGAIPLPAGQVLVTLTGAAARQRSSVEAFILGAYNYAMS
jgi:hypothetical protein